jgi:hypothetical protein
VWGGGKCGSEHFKSTLPELFSNLKFGESSRADAPMCILMMSILKINYCWANKIMAQALSFKH